MKRAFMILAAIALITGCYKSDLTTLTPPDEGRVHVEVILPTPDPSADIDDVTTPEGYTAIVNGQEVFVDKDGSQELPEGLEPGEYTVYVYSNSEELVMDHDVTDSGEGTIISSKIVDSGVVKSLTEDLFFGTETVIVYADQIVVTNVNLAQITRTIKFNLKLTEGDIEDIVAVTASMGGIAGQWECIEDIPIGDMVTINPNFIQGESLTKAEANDYLTSSIKVLGIHGDEQALNLVLTFANGNTQKISSEVSDQLAGSNDTKSTPIILSGNLKVNTEFGATGTITDWVVSDNGYDFDANQPNQ